LPPKKQTKIYKFSREKPPSRRPRALLIRLTLSPYILKKGFSLRVSGESKNPKFDGANPAPKVLWDLFLNPKRPGREIKKHDNIFIFYLTSRINPRMA
jgi:hypothetical protein